MLNRRESGPKPTPRARRRKPRSWKSIVRICVVPLFALACVVGFFYEEHSFQREKQEKWTTVVATIEDTRTEIIAQHASQYGGAMLYEVDVLASYSVDGVARKTWIPLSQHPQLLADARQQQSLLKGKQCFIRWNPAHPEQIIAEIS